MDEDLKAAMEEMFEGIEDALTKARTVHEMSDKIHDLMKPHDLPMKLSMMTIVCSRIIMEDAEDMGDAMAYAGRLFHTLVDIFDRNIKENDEEEDDESGTLQ